jgi:hypothetical protein
MPVDPGACAVTKWSLGNELASHVGHWDSIRTQILLQVCPSLNAITSAYVGVSSDPNSCKVRSAQAVINASQWVAHHDATIFGNPPSLGTSQQTQELINEIDCSSEGRDEQLAQAAEAVRLMGVWLGARVNEYTSMQLAWYELGTECPIPPPTYPPPPPPGPPPP